MISDEVLRLAKSSVKKQRVAVKLLLADGTGLTAKDPVARLNRSHIDAALNQARARGVQESTMNTYRTDLRRLGGWLLSCSLVKTDPARHLRNVHSSTPKSKRRPVNADQAHSLVDIADAIHPRDGMTCLLMLTTGLRDSEVMGLRWADLDLTTRSGAAYRPKRRDYHTLHLPKQLCVALEKWQAFIEERHGPIEPTWYVVPALSQGSLPGTPTHMNRDWPMVPTRKQGTASARAKTWLAGVGEKDLKGRASHTLRRTAANILYQRCGDIRTVQTFLGHASVAMTEMYLDIDAAQDQLRTRMMDFEI
jgi:integrase/recombinase XerC